MERRRVLSLLMVIGIVGYLTVPGVANYIIHAGGGNSLLQKVNNVVGRTSQSAVGASRAGMGMAADALGNQWQKVTKSMSSFGQNSSYFDDDKSIFQKDKLSGK